MAKTMQMPLTGQQHDQWLDIHHDLGPAEHHQTEAAL